MATYAIGDLQGCFADLLKLLDHIAFNQNQDRLWLTGDLVNRGPQSLETLRFVKNLADQAICVLGNHDLMLLRAAKKEIQSEHNCHAILTAPDKTELLNWLQYRPLLHFDPTFNITLVHAGILPLWDLKTATTLAQEAEAVLQGDQADLFFDHLYGNQPDTWDPNLQGFERIRFIINVFTRVRFCNDNGTLEFETKTPAKQAPKGFSPWFYLYEKYYPETKIIFGHWSALEKVHYHHFFALDTGCVWGRQLSALRLEDFKLFQIDCCNRSIHSI